jgi:hypothetical protein
MSEKTQKHKYEPKKHKQRHEVSKHFISTGQMAAPKKKFYSGPRQQEEIEEKYQKRTLEDNSGKYEETVDEETFEKRRERDFENLKAKMEKTTGYTSYLNSHEKEWDSSNSNVQDIEFVLNIDQIVSDLKFLSIRDRLLLPDESWIANSLKIGLIVENSEESIEREIPILPVGMKKEVKSDMTTRVEDLEKLNQILGIVPEKKQDQPIIVQEEVKTKESEKDLDEWLNDLL